MKATEAKKTLDAIGYDPAKGTRRLTPEKRASAKKALNVLAKAGESYKKKTKAPKKVPETKLSEDKG